MKRLSRQERQQLTRQSLVTAAANEITCVGIYDATIRRICDAAGYTLGAFYSNFTSKDELLLEVVEVQTAREFGVLERLVEETATFAEYELLEKIAAWLRELQGNRILSGLSLEFEVYAKHHPAFRDKYVENKKKWHDELTRVLESLFSQRNLAPKIPPAQMAIALSALWSGLVIEGSVPGVDPADKLIPLFLGVLLESSGKVSV